MHNIKLSDKQAGLLKLFLGRTVIQGNEVVKFMDLAKAIGQAEVVPDPIDIDALEGVNSETLEDAVSPEG